MANANDAPTVANAIADQSGHRRRSRSASPFAANTFADVDVGDTLTYSACRRCPSWLDLRCGRRAPSAARRPTPMSVR
ncbi:MAG: hypothetical protein MZV64_20020 [Ignavibacteriales bacterium]|nr:hypothetical protein [Ignavibacteriales bacterium]